jgi:lactoylglutathione lyase
MLKYLHTMIRVTDLEKSLHFYTQGLGFKIESRQDYEGDRFSLVFLRAESDQENGPMIELTHNWDTQSYTRGDAYGHTAYRVDSIDAVQKRLKENGYDLSWGPGLTPSKKTKMAFVDDPDGYEIELLETQGSGKL